MSKADAILARDAEIERVLDHLVSAPGVAHSAQTTATARALLLKTDGQVTARGRLWDVAVRPLGAGVQRITLKATP